MKSTKIEIVLSRLSAGYRTFLHQNWIRRKIRHLDDGSIGYVVKTNFKSEYPLFVAFEDGTFDWLKTEWVTTI